MSSSLYLIVMLSSQGQPIGDRDPLETESQKPKPSMLSWGFYQRYFDVDTEQVKERLMWSFLPRPSKDTLTHFIRPSPDLYGTSNLSCAR